MSTLLLYAHLKTPIGPLLVAGDGRALRSIAFPERGRPRPAAAGWRHDPAALQEALSQLSDYFDGGRTAFDLSLAFSGSPFDEAVWQALSEIPYGVTVSYGEIARRIGEGPAAARAVGVACGTNPLPIVIPCHRVIGANGALTGFGGGLETKSFLLSLERRVAPQPGQQLALFD